MTQIQIRARSDVWYTRLPIVRTRHPYIGQTFTRNSFTVWLSGCMYVHTCMLEMCTCRCLYRYVTCRCAKNVHQARIHSTIIVKQNAFFLHIRIRITKNAYSRSITRIHTLKFRFWLCLKSRDCLCQIRCSMLQHAVQHCTAHCNTLQHTATHCNTLQHTATRCNTLQHTEHSATHITVAVYFQWAQPPSWQLPSVLVCVLSCVVVRCNYIAVCCIVQRVASNTRSLLLASFH